MGLISVIVVTHNSQAHIEACLASVLAQQNQAWELTVIDNASVDQTRQILKSKFPQVKLIENHKNYGYARALNQGIAASRGEFIFCLNDDVTLQSQDFLVLASQALVKHSRCGSLQPKLLRPEGTIDTTGIYLSCLRRFYDLNSGRPDSAGLNQEKYIFGACDAAALYRRQALKDVKQSSTYFDEDFFGLVEDVDISWRLNKKNWSCLYLPGVVALHRRGLSRQRDRFTQYLNFRNRYLMLIKNETGWGFLRLPLVFLVYDLWRILWMLLTNTRYTLKACAEIAVLTPRMMRKRQEHA